MSCSLRVSTSTMRKTFISVIFSLQTINLHGSQMFLLCCTENGEVFVCGQNHRGQLGLGHNTDISTLQLCPSLSQQVSKVACGWDFTLLLTGEHLFPTGCNALFNMTLDSERCHSFMREVKCFHQVFL